MTVGEVRKYLTHSLNILYEGGSENDFLESILELEKRLGEDIPDRQPPKQERSRHSKNYEAAFAPVGSV